MKDMSFCCVWDYHIVLGIIYSFVYLMIIIFRKLKDARKDVAAAREEKDILSTEQQQLLREKTKLELGIKDLTDDVDGDNKSKVGSRSVFSF